MPIDSVIEENIIELRNKEMKKEELSVLVNTTIKDMWLKDLKHLEDKFDSYVKQENRLYGTVKEKSAKSAKSAK